MTWEKGFAELIEEYFAEKKKKNPKYSMRALAKKLDISIGSLSDLLSQKRALSVKNTLRILGNIQVPQEKKNKVLSLMGRNIAIERKDLTYDQYALVTEWIYSAVMVFFELSNVDHTVAGVCEHLGLTESRAQEIVSFLLQRGLLEEVNGKFVRRQPSLQAVGTVPSQLIRARHKVNLDLAIKSIELYHADERDITNMVFAGDAAQLDQLRQEIRQLHARTSTLMESGPRSEIYTLTVALHPLNKGAVLG